MQSTSPPVHPSPGKSESSPPVSSDARQPFKERVRQWRQEAILQAVAELLLSQGCTEFTMDDLARRVGIAKGSLYLHTNARSDLVGQVLDRWAAEVPKGVLQSGLSWEERRRRACDALFSGVARGGEPHGPLAPAIPCCLSVSPCPHGWAGRWKELARDYELLGTAPQAELTPEVVLLGEAIQALASTLSVRGLLQGGRLSEVRGILQRWVEGSGSSPETRSA